MIHFSQKLGRLSVLTRQRATERDEGRERGEEERGGANGEAERTGGAKDKGAREWREVKNRAKDEKGEISPQM